MNKLLSLFQRLVAAFSICTIGCASVMFAHEVTVYAYVTDAGRKCAAPTTECPAWCVMVQGSGRDFGDVAADSRPASPALVDRLVRGAMRTNHYAPLRTDSPRPALMLVYHWGCMSPSMITTTPDEPPHFINALNLLTLVGGRALDRADLPSERDAILADATDERYFLIVSAYDFAALETKKARTLLWRTQMSVPSAGLTSERALPLLATAGAALFGRETPLPRRIELRVAGRLNTEAGSP